MSIEGLEGRSFTFTKHRAVWAMLAAVCVTVGGCSSSFSEDDCDASRTCASNEGGSGGVGGGGGAAGTPAEASGGADEAGAGPIDSGGASPTCDAGLTACGGECVSTKSNPDHCGACDNACAIGSVCGGAQCIACPSTAVGCDGTCIYPATDRGFCGASADCREENRGAACDSSEICKGGVCRSEDASLESLSLDPALLTPEFDPATLSYEATFSYFEPYLSLSAVPASEAATLSYADAAFTADDPPQIVATPEENLSTVSVEVTAESGKQQSYDISLRRGALTTTFAKAFNSRAGFAFGSSVAVDGNTVVFGAPSEDGASSGVDGNENATGSTGSGAAYVAFRSPEGKWSRQAYLKADQPEANASFGEAVAIDGDTIAVGAPRANDSAGVVLVFVRDGSTWTQQATIVDPLPDSGQLFGSRVAIQDDRLIVGAPYSNATLYHGGAVYSYTRTGSTWKADTTHPVAVDHVKGRGLYGTRLSLSGERVAIAQSLVGGLDSSVVIMRSSGTDWMLEGAVSLPSNALDAAAVALDGDTLAASAPGVVHIFTRSGSSWTKQASLSPFNAAATEGFGASLSMKGGLLAVGSACPTCAGAVSTFVRNGDGWSNGAYVTAKDLGAGDQLGFSVSVSGNRVVAGAPGDDSTARSFNQTGTDAAVDSGAAFIFE